MRDLVLGTAGHIDHGKTALVRALTGEKTDRLPEEKRRGITIDLGFAAMEVDGTRFALVDVPGHERFIRNMLAGATGLDAALLVVAADDSVMPQTREHLDILRLLRLPAGVVALSKCDLADASWLDLVEEDVRVLLAGSFLEGAPIVRTSSASGMGIGELREALSHLADRTPPRVDPGPFRMAIDRSFTMAGHGTVVTGTIASGEVAVGDSLEWLPEERTVRVRGLQRHGESVDRLGRGNRAALNLVGVHHDEMVRGQEVATPGYLRPSRVLSVEVRSSEDAPRSLRHRGRYRLHLGTAEVPATLSILEASGDGTMLAQLSLAAPVVAVHGEPFVLREESPPATIGGGRVLQPLARRLRRRDAASIARVAVLAEPSAEARLRGVFALRGLDGGSELELCRDAGIPLVAVSSALANMTRDGDLIDLPIGSRRSRLVPRETLNDLEDRLRRALGRLHDARPRQSAIDRAHLAAELPDVPGEGLIAALVGRLADRGEVVVTARTVSRSDRQPKLSQAERRLKGELAEALRVGGFRPPDAAEMAETAGPRGAVVLDLLRLLVEEGVAVEMGPGLFLDADADAELQRRVVQRLAGGASLTMADLRDLLDTTRRFAVPIGEYLDRIGLTRRVGDHRLLVDSAEGLS